MKFYESGDSSKPVIFLFPGTCCLYSSFDHVLDGLHSYFYTVTVSYDGFDPNEKTEFTVLRQSFFRYQIPSVYAQLKIHFLAPLSCRYMKLEPLGIQRF